MKHLLFVFLIVMIAGCTPSTGPETYFSGAIYFTGYIASVDYSTANPVLFVGEYHADSARVDTSVFIYDYAGDRKNPRKIRTVVTKAEEDVHGRELLFYVREE